VLSTGRAILFLWTLSVAALAGVLVIAELEREGSPVGVPIVDGLLSPNDDNILDSIEITLNPPKSVRVSLRVIDGNDKSVAVIARKKSLGKGIHTFEWDGTRSSGRAASDGTYRIQITDHSSGRTLTVPTDISLDTKPPALGEPKIDVTRVNNLGVVRVAIPVRDATEIWLELDGERLVTNRIRPRRADIENGQRTKVTISGRLPQGTTTASLAKGSEDQLRFVAVDRAGNRSEAIVNSTDLSSKP
jgi:hypothetical protein